jgi:AcrR family transcriptional regulator
MATSSKKTAASRAAALSSATHAPDPQPAGWRNRVVRRSLEQATQRSLDRGQGFVDAAIELLRRSDSDGFTLQEVGVLAGQSVRTFYQHFSSKDDLLLAVFEEEVRKHALTLRTEVMRHADPVERIAAFMIAGASTRVEEAGDSRALIQYRIGLSLSHPEDLAQIQAPVVELALDLVLEAMDQGAIRRGDPDPAAYMMVTLKTSILHSRMLGNELGVRTPQPIELARFCLEGLGGSLPESFVAAWASPVEQSSEYPVSSS